MVDILIVFFLCLPIMEMDVTEWMVYITSLKDLHLMKIHILNGEQVTKLLRMTGGKKNTLILPIMPVTATLLYVLELQQTVILIKPVGILMMYRYMILTVLT